MDEKIKLVRILLEERDVLSRMSMEDRLRRLPPKNYLSSRIKFSPYVGRRNPCYRNKN